MNADSKLPSFSDWTAQIQQRTEVALADVLPDPAVAPQRLHEAMRYALDGFTRPEWEAEDAADDLRFLAKQGVSLANMAEVMGTMICVRPTLAMNTALKRLYESTPHWIGMTANLRH